MTFKLEQLRAMTTVVADTGDIEAVRRLKPVDCTTNPTIVLKALGTPMFADTVAEALRWGRTQGGKQSSAHGTGMRGAQVGPQGFGPRIIPINCIPCGLRALGNRAAKLPVCSQPRQGQPDVDYSFHMTASEYFSVTPPMEAALPMP